MKRLTVLSAALAAGLTSFAAHAENVSLPGVEALGTGLAEAGQAKEAPAAEARQVDPVTTGSVAAAAAAAPIAALNAAAKARTGGAEQVQVEQPQAEKPEAKQLEVKKSEPKRPELVATARKAVMFNEFGKSAPTAGDKELLAETKSGAREKAAVLKGGGKYHDIVAKYASAYGVPVTLAHAVISIESNYRANATGRAGEIGLMQIKASTARMMGYSGSAKGLYNPETNIKYGMKYLGKARELGGGTTCGTILRYNAGHGATRMNPVSAAYCSKVKRRLGSA